MAERATIFETMQIGVETTPGVAVAANRKLGSLGITAAPRLTSSRFRPRGRKLDTLVVPGRRDSAGPVEGRLTYNEPQYPLSSICGPAVISTPVGATLAREWLFDIAASGADNGKAYTVEIGSSVRAGRFAHGIFTGLGMDFGTEEITLNGDIMGHKWQDGVTMTASPTEIDLVPVDPNDVTIYVDDTFAGLGTTPMERLFAARFGIGGKYGPVWVINAANPSWVTAVELPADATLGLTFAADAVGMDFLDVFEEGATRYVRIEAVGAEIETDQDYLFRADFAAKAEQVSFDDQDGVVGAAWVLRLVEAPSLVGLKVLLRNERAAL